MAKKKATKRPVLGEHFCGWKWEGSDGGIIQSGGTHDRKPAWVHSSYGKWVRVRFEKV